MKTYTAVVDEKFPGVISLLLKRSKKRYKGDNWKNRGWPLPSVCTVKLPASYGEQTRPTFHWQDGIPLNQNLLRV